MELGDAIDNMDDAIEDIVKKRLIDFDKDELVNSHDDLWDMFNVPDNMKPSGLFANIFNIDKDISEGLEELYNLPNGYDFLGRSTKIMEIIISLMLAKLIEFGMDQEVATDYLSGLLMIYGSAMNHCVYSGRNDIAELLKENKYLVDETEYDKLVEENTE